MKMYDDQLIVITGGAGFIGSCVVKHLNNKGMNNLIIVDDLGKDEKWKNLVGKKFVEIIATQSFFKWRGGRESDIEAFIHLGACSSTVEKDAGFLLENNYRFSINLAEYALENEHRFIYASSAATYGDGSNGFSDDHDLLESLKPLNMYGYSKQLFDLWLKNQGLLNKVVGLKYFNVFGPNEAHKDRMASAVSHIFPTALNDGIIRLFKSNDPKNFKDGGQCRDFIYVKDAARMTCQFLENDAVGIFNIGTGKPETWNNVANSVFKAIGKPAKINYIDMPEDLDGKYQNYTAADMKKAKKVLLDKANCLELEESVADYVQNYLMTGDKW